MELRFFAGRFEFVEREVDGPNSVEERGGSGELGRVVRLSELLIFGISSGSEPVHEKDGSDGEVEEEEERAGAEPARHERSPHKDCHCRERKRLERKD